MNKIYDIETFIYQIMHIKNDIVLLNDGNNSHRTLISFGRFFKTLKEIDQIEYDLDI